MTEYLWPAVALTFVALAYMAWREWLYWYRVDVEKREANNTTAMTVARGVELKCNALESEIVKLKNLVGSARK